MRALTSSDLARFRLPEGPFRVPSGAFRVTDGDTIKIMSGLRDSIGRDMVALRIRFRSIAAPEMRRNRWVEAPLAAIGPDPSLSCPGRAAKDLLSRFVRGRDLIVSHYGQFDPYGRLLADMSVLPSRNARLEEAISLERVLLARGAVDRFGIEPVPRLNPFGDNPAPLP